MNRVILVRTVILVSFLIGLGLLYLWLRSTPQDVPKVIWPPVNSAGYIAAVMETRAGERLVTLAPDGEIREAPGDGEPHDKEIAWSPDGQWVVFVSNRASDGSFQIFQWLPDRDNEPRQLTPNGASRQNPWFHPTGDYLLFASRGDIYGLRYPQRRIWKVMPPSDQPEAVEDLQDDAHPSEHRYNPITQAWNALAADMEGENFDEGFLDPTGKFFVGIYSTPRAKVLVLQNLQPPEGEEAASVPAGGEQIEVSVHHEQLLAAVAVLNFKYPILKMVPPELIKPDGTVIRNFANALFLVHLDTGKLEPVFVAVSPDQAVISPVLSPDGSQIAAVLRERSGDRYKTVALILIPARSAGIREARQIASGDVGEPAWSPDGQKIAFVRDGDIWTVRPDGTDEKNLTNGRGRFRSPLFSPMR